jgi:S-DNA-T family DNA segregation ATPase FtsK/SpoIIIE
VGLFDHMTDDKRRQLVGVLLLFLGLLVGVSLATHVYFSVSDDLGPEIWTTQLGLQNRQLASSLFELLGLCAWVVPVLLVMWGWNRIADGEPGPLALKTVFILAVSMIAVSLVYIVGGERAASLSGLAGAFVADFGTRHIGKVGTFLCGLGAIVAITLLTTEFNLDALTSPFVALGEGLSSVLSNVRDWIVSRAERPAKKKSAGRTSSRAGRGEREGARRRKEKAATAAGAQRRSARAEEEGVAKEKRPRRAPSKPKIMENARRSATKRAPKRPPKRVPVAGDFRLPPLSLLDDPPPESHAQVSHDELLARSRLLEDKLADFDVEASVVQVHPGPVITRFEIEPARGVKVSRIANLQDDLALAMRATAIRIIAPIPGRGAVGIEIPNEHPAVVYLKDTLAADAFQGLKSEIPLACS